MQPDRSMATRKCEPALLGLAVTGKVPSLNDRTVVDPSMCTALAPVK